ncbi:MULTISPECIES: sigma factor-like helix-turn-helix DNA-binding protein [unclassified Streptomyces]|uniref:Sigma factor-like helix-turn-helix DNA-binding protein n=1 Tax=Streptomyces johnsoniae TaxID=3075532 RepID=A0ABU2RWQ9_9ACTN|nr:MULTISPECIES: sigma factor-like helix-turn-helix DNA-binding protein [unclassified Streptomyces]MDT0441186.1 sigma factor-like helix-turn-helix DNA-binding protein [Streptomyces sp. DSM 41886]ONK11009.1 RNA polymerase sigma factor SigE [Streptomyces sp. MP131-18]
MHTEPEDLARAAGPRVRAALAALPETQRALVGLTAGGRRTVAEAAAALGVRRTTARLRLRRARRTLRAAARTEAAERAAAALPLMLTYSGRRA